MISEREVNILLTSFGSEDNDPITVRNPPPLFHHEDERELKDDFSMLAKEVLNAYEAAVMVRPIHVITDDVTERWPKASWSIDDIVFVRLEPGIYASGPITLILPSEYGETVYVISVDRRLIIRTKGELAL